ncbi:hypothetical protein AgCh_025558 [Apium graveolens]
MELFEFVTHPPATSGSKLAPGWGKRAFPSRRIQSSHRFPYGYLVTTLPQSKTPPWPPSIPLSFRLATVLPRRSVSRVSWAPDPRRPRANTHRLWHGLSGICGHLPLHLHTLGTILCHPTSNPNLFIPLLGPMCEFYAASPCGPMEEVKTVRGWKLEKETKLLESILRSAIRLTMTGRAKG